ncbi:DNA binding domain-containing protein, excisionase family [Riemerella columbipharyngis]|uniref:DNA binding domain-containing protein, excisionase family n=1 Tax=Riemerella columbipharyngis TaxID=1071918 RepID=A0A1G7DDN6_9FLAO|nr:DNA binding domain-containing protein, excisionase family [Riemerella columbipharyngis]
MKVIVKSKETIEINNKKIPISIDEACKIIKKAKPTVYTLVRKRQIPHYKNGKKLYFYEEELLEWISKGKRKTIQEIDEIVFQNRKRV